MADNSDEAALDSFLANPQQAAQPAQMDSSPDDEAALDAFMGDATDPATGDLRPQHADGSSPDRAINRSPVSMADRFKMSMGNTAGKLSYLKNNFEEVVPGKSGDFRVKKNGTWFQVDPEGLGDGDAWSRTKELVADTVDWSETAAATAGSMLGGAAGTLATPGAGTVVGSGLGAGAVKGITTSMGKAWGTYEATPEDQIKEIGFETLLNMGGAAIPYGVKPTARVIGSALTKAADTLGSMSAGAKSLTASILGATSGAKPHNVLRYMERPKEVLEKFNGALGGSEDDIISRLSTSMINDVKQLAGSTRTALSKFYKTGLEDVAQYAPATFDGIGPKAARMTLSGLEAAELGTFTKAKAVMDSSGKIVSKQPAQFVMKPYEEILRMQQETGLIEDVAKSKELYALSSEFVDQLNKWSGATHLQGKAGVAQFVKAEKSLRDSVLAITSKAQDLGEHNFAKYIEGWHNSFDSSFTELAEKGMGGSKKVLEKFSGLKQEYSLMLTQMQPLLAAQHNAIKAGSNKAYEGFLKEFLSGAGKNQVSKASVEHSISKLGGVMPEITQAANSIKDASTAAAFVPKVRNNIVTMGLFSGVVGGAATGNLGVAAGGLALVGATSPRATGAALRGASGAMQTAVKGAQMGRQFLTSLPPAKLKQFVTSDEAVEGFFKAMVNVPDLYDQHGREMMNAADPNKIK